MHRIDATARSAASPHVVFPLVADGSTWPQWSGIGSFELERPGASAREGIGAIRAFRTWPVTSREEIVELVPGVRLGYALLSGLPLRGYRAAVELSPLDDGGTLIRWRSSFTAKIPGTGWFYRWFLGRFIQQCADGLAAHAARIAGQRADA
ncbi:SRPBCC family protein [Longispora albida]|uniref:SRPBCC family protein n=1 Tax=Longispora albida TaxID=203523 RepID=UPI00036D8F43|nr:SRPBCC family protein [Longispora albida]